MPPKVVLWTKQLPREPKLCIWPGAFDHEPYAMLCTQPACNAGSCTIFMARFILTPYLGLKKSSTDRYSTLLGRFLSFLSKSGLTISTSKR